MPRLQHLAPNLSRLYPWTTSPLIVSAPMRVMSGPALAVAVSRAGGLGFVNNAIQNVAADLEQASSLISSSALKTIPSPHLPIGVGFLLWADDLDTAVETIQKYKPCAVWLYAPPNGQADLDTWSRGIRAASPGTQIWIQIGTLSEARSILKSAEKPDVVVVQGAEAGGHGRAKDAMGLISLLPEVADAMAGSQIPLFAAGGIADGRGAAAALCLGASGVVMGTRFLAASETRIARGYQQEVVRAEDGAVGTTKTLLYNHLRGTFGWPEEYMPRTVINRSWVEHLAGKGFEELKVLHDEAAKQGDQAWGPEGRLATYAGASIGLVHEVKDAESIVREVREQVLERFASMGGQ
ncbi:oxidoreductase 2-nitropropane dioxygenase family [Aspergillus costaricaensis CBS 115574]|uniref:Oxidoreductase 2-nitropropane dioxygenase family n=1 Tax=Aspergillus costaricaensis CBS 115574 TaxID=1448317 RepID=A0ACD1IFP9_9EURO|nr:oxidoreductase 2-nitropropane dioxygenase family [Aspergillus costaricaensis CBS 115574]RAK89391.1 oxidoreductase 2-nitropropane dioxygenase family [Aspergillus costaricaensis CBS 115574]